MYKLLIADDEPLVQAGIRSMLDWDSLNIEITDTVMNGKAALESIEANMPDIVITDIKMPIMSGLELTRICREKYGYKLPVFILLTSYEDFQLAKEAVSYQVIEYLVKIELTAENLRSSIEKAITVIEENSDNKYATSDKDTYAFYDKFFIRLINNLFENKEQFELQCNDLKLDLNYPAFVCCYGKIVSDNTGSIAMTGHNNPYITSIRMMHELIGKYNPFHLLSLDREYFILILCFKEVRYDYGDVTKEIIASFSSTIHNYYNVHLFIGIGSQINDPYLMEESYQLAKQSFSHTNANEPVVYFEEALDDTSYRQSFNIALFKADLTKAFEEFDATTLNDVLHQIRELFSEQPGSYVQAMDAVCNILYLAISLLPEGEKLMTEIFASYPDNYRSVHRQANLEQVLAWLDFFRENVCRLILEKKQDYKNHIVVSVKRYIHEHVKSHLTLSEVSGVFGISANYLSQLFRKYSECGFNEYVTMAKVDESKKLLTQNHLKVYEVADTLGFESAFYFSKVFKKVEGISPSEYVSMHNL